MKKLDKTYYHEAIDRCYCFNDLIDEKLLQHPAVQKHKRIKKRVSKAVKLLTETYQMLGGRL